MAISLTHTTVAVGTDAGNGEIRKAQWNEQHTLTVASQKLIGRTTALTGAAEEIGVGSGLSLASLTLSLSDALASIGVLTPAADNLVYYTGASTASLSALTSFARSLLDDADASTARSTLSVQPTDSPTFTSSLTLLRTGGAGDVLFEIGRVDGTAAAATIDFHSGATATDYDARISATGGTGASAGGSLEVIAANINLTGRTTTSRIILNDGYTEEVFAITDGASVILDPNNGSIQTWTLGASRTPDQANWATGQSITLMIDDGSAYSITWTTLGVVWKTGGGTAPTLSATGLTPILLWKVGTTIYGGRVGDS